MMGRTKEDIKHQICTFVDTLDTREANLLFILAKSFSEKKLEMQMKREAENEAE